MWVVHGHKTIEFEEATGVGCVFWSRDHDFSVARFVIPNQQELKQLKTHLHGIVPNFIYPYPNTRRQARSHDRELFDQV